MVTSEEKKMKMKSGKSPQGIKCVYYVLLLNNLKKTILRFAKIRWQINERYFILYTSLYALSILFSKESKNSASNIYIQINSKLL